MGEDRDLEHSLAALEEHLLREWQLQSGATGTGGKRPESQAHRPKTLLERLAAFFGR